MDQYCCDSPSSDFVNGRIVWSPDRTLQNNVNFDDDDDDQLLISYFSDIIVVCAV